MLKKLKNIDEKMEIDLKKQKQIKVFFGGFFFTDFYPVIILGLGIFFWPDQ